MRLKGLIIVSFMLIVLMGPVLTIPARAYPAAAAATAWTGNRVIVSAQTVLCVDVNSRSTGDGTAVIQWNCNGATNQMWSLANVGGNYYTIRAQHSSKCMDVSGASKLDGAKIVQWSCNNQANQIWEMKPAGESFTLVSKNSGRCLTLASTSAGTQLVQKTCNGARTQLWTSAAMYPTLPWDTNAARSITVPKSGMLYKDLYDGLRMTFYQLTTNEYTTDYHLAANGLTAAQRGALDFAVGMGTPVKAVASGKVTAMGTSVCMLQITQDDGRIARYLHLSNYNVKNNDRVVAGQVIGRSGGMTVINATEPKKCGGSSYHLHFGLLEGNKEIRVMFGQAPWQSRGGYVCPSGLVCPQKGSRGIYFTYP
jgi:hypothetical protein